MKEAARVRGGRAYLLRDEKEFDRAYSEIAQLVRHEYSNAFRLPSSDGQLHTFEVKVKRFCCCVDHGQA